MNARIIAITTGDPKGIGLEVTMKALKAYRGKNIFLILRGNAPRKICYPSLPRSKSIVTNSLNQALELTSSANCPYQFIEVVLNENPALWVAQAAQLCIEHQLDGLVTGPVSKKTFLDANLGSLGHTPLLQKICGVESAYMGFLGRHFNVALLSGHIPLVNIEKSLNRRTLLSGLKIIDQWRKLLPESRRTLPLGILALNPHGGENGLIGSFERKVLGPILRDHPRWNGPLVPDAAFDKSHWNQFSFYVALYHDQGLIPFKMTHGHAGGAHVTIGLPIVRTSVDHGVALDIVGKGIARCESMRDAIQWCELLIERKRLL